MIRNASMAAVIYFFVQQASADSIYAEVDYMLLDMDLMQTSSAAKPAALQLRLGSIFWQFVGLEVVFDTGINDDNFSPSGNTSATAKLNNLLGFNLLGRIPISNVIEIFGRVGYAKMDITVTGLDSTLGVPDSDYNNSDLQYSAGAGMILSRFSTVTLEFAQLPKVDLPRGYTIETSAVNLGYKYTF